MTEADLEEILSDPTPDLVSDLRQVDGDIIVLGAGGKMGPSLVRLARRATQDAATPRRVVAVSRFSDPSTRAALDASGAETISCDLFDADAVAALPDAPNVVYMAGRKFGTRDNAAATWATNAYLPGVIADRYRQSRIVAFSTGNVYPLHPAPGPGPTERDPVAPVGDYAVAALARERVFEFFSERHRTPMAIARLNYAIEPRYGVLRDIADAVRGRRPIDLAMGYVNLIWQRDANAVALRLLRQCAVPPLMLNVTGAVVLSVRELAEAFGRRFDVAPRFTGDEAATALLSDASESVRLFGAPPVGISEMIEHVAEWMAAGGRSLGRPTHFTEREGTF
ncbi:MAG TPA: NAD(P)-dependent oxidoreductase [Gemmatimonadales bacterium]